MLMFPVVKVRLTLYLFSPAKVGPHNADGASGAGEADPLYLFSPAKVGPHNADGASGAGEADLLPLALVQCDQLASIWTRTWEKKK